MRLVNGKLFFKPLFIGVLLLLAWSGLSTATDFSAEIFYWDPSNDLTSEAGDAGRVINFTDLFGFSDDSVLGIRLRWIYRSGTHMTFEYMVTDNSGTKHLEGDIEWEDEIYPVDSLVMGTFELTQYGIDWEFPLREYDLNNRKGRIFWLAGIRGYRIEASLEEAGEPDTRREFEDTLIGIPVLGFGFDWPFTEKWNFNFYFSGVSVEDYGYIYDGKAILAYHFSDRAFLTLGYRNMVIKAKDSGDFARTDLDGLYASVGYSF